uniref:Putative secreted protein n=1 Tax=Anopheles darlingi TaxID=43151 RepID=A0A2M4DPM8_ANODA
MLLVLPLLLVLLALYLPFANPYESASPVVRLLPVPVGLPHSDLKSPKESYHRRVTYCWRPTAAAAVGPVPVSVVQR